MSGLAVCHRANYGDFVSSLSEMFEMLAEPLSLDGCIYSTQRAAVFCWRKILGIKGFLMGSSSR